MKHTIVLCSGLGGSPLDWRDTAAILRRDGHRVVVVERAGYRLDHPELGWVPTVRGEVATIEKAVEAETGPVVLVGHSIASIYTEAFLRLHPEKVSRLILLDAAIESAPLGVLPRGLRLLAARWGASFAANTGLQYLGAAPSRVLLTRAVPPDGWDPDVVRQVLGIYRRPSFLASAMAEYAVFSDLADELDQLRGDVPLPRSSIIVVAAHTGVPTPWGRSWVRRQRQFARSLRARFTVVEPSYHHIMIDQPRRVADLCIGPTV
jgi:pimeloyl-ACP methyl ester carboxylesterase